MTTTIETVRELVRQARVAEKRGRKNWVRNGPGDEQMARDYWLRADILRMQAKSYGDTVYATVLQEGQ